MPGALRGGRCRPTAYGFQTGRRWEAADGRLTAHYGQSQPKSRSSFAAACNESRGHCTPNDSQPEEKACLPSGLWARQHESRGVGRSIASSLWSCPLPIFSAQEPVFEHVVLECTLPRRANKEDAHAL